VVGCGAGTGPHGDARDAAQCLATWSGLLEAEVQDNKVQ
jgi:hypothetical protein